jgi:hypothetical protein
MTSHVGRLYAAAGALLVFFVLWAAIAAHPGRAAAADPRIAALAAREQRVHHESLRAKRVLDRRFAAYRTAFAQRERQIAHARRQIALVRARHAAQLAAARAAAAASAASAASVASYTPAASTYTPAASYTPAPVTYAAPRVVTLPPVTITRTS